MSESLNQLLIDGYSVKKVKYDPFTSGIFLRAIPVTREQKELWSFINCHEVATLCFNDALKVEFLDYIESDLLDIAFRMLIQNHDALRMVFSSNGELISLKEDSNASLIYHDFTNLKEADEFLKEICTKEVLLPFDLEKGPCIRGYFIKLKNNRSVLILSVHRLVCDRNSLRVLLNDLATYYNSLLLGKKTFPATRSFFDYTLTANLSVKFKIDFIEDLSLVKAKHIPTDFERPVEKRFRSKRLDFSIPESTVRSIKGLCTIEKCSIENTLVAVLGVLVSRLTHCDEVTMGIVKSNHDSREENHLIGHLETILPLKIQLAQTENFRMLLKEVRKKMSKAFSYPELAKNNSFDIVFNVEQFLNFEDLKFGNVKVRYASIPREFECSEIFINAIITDHCLAFECQYNSELYEISSITNWLQLYAELLSSLSEFKTETIEKICISKITKF